MLDPAFDDKHLFHSRWPNSGRIDALGRVLPASAADATHPLASAAARILFVLPFAAMLGIYLYDRVSRPKGSGVGSGGGGAGHEEGDHGPALGSEDARYMRIFQRRQVAASVLAVGVVGVGLTLRMVTGRTDHGSVVFAIAIVALFASYQLSTRCPRCGVSLGKAARKRPGSGWLVGERYEYWRLVRCPDCGVRLRSAR